jgi:DNA-binding FadR family transcriptional regulator
MSLQERVVSLILDRGLGPGDVVPPEPQLMAELGASRNSVREALRALHTLGIVDIRHGHGTVVGHAPMTAMLPALRFRAQQAVRHDADDLAELVQVRRILEVALIDEAARRADDRFLADLDETIAEMETGNLAEADRRFHLTLYQRVDNEIATQLIDLFWTVYHQVDLGPTEWKRAEIIANHRLILHALRAGDPAAARAAMSAHFADIETRSRRLPRPAPASA